MAVGREHMGADCALVGTGCRLAVLLLLCERERERIGDPETLQSIAEAAQPLLCARRGLVVI